MHSHVYVCVCSPGLSHVVETRQGQGTLELANKRVTHAYTSRNCIKRTKQ